MKHDLIPIRDNDRIICVGRYGHKVEFIARYVSPDTVSQKQGNITTVFSRQSVIKNISDNTRLLIAVDRLVDI